MCISWTFSVSVGEYAKQHHIKSFQKKYATAWSHTWCAIELLLMYLPSSLLTSKAEEIHKYEHLALVKCEFAIAWSWLSPHASGNRCIVLCDYDAQTCTVLLVYAKTNINGQRETCWWEQEVKNAYTELVACFSL